MSPPDLRATQDRLTVMTDKPESAARDYSETLFLPQTEFPMRAGLPQREPQLLQRWNENNLYERLREVQKGGPLAGHAGLRFQLRARLGLPRPADRVEDRGGVSRQGQEQGR